MFPKKAWYAASTPDEIENEPVGETIYTAPIVFYRDVEGKVAAVEDFCPHRGLPSPLGTVQNGLLACGYHGLTMDADGKCVRMPYQRVRGIPVIRSFPVIERQFNLGMDRRRAARRSGADP